MKSTWYGIVMAAGVVVGSGGVSAQALPPPIPPPPPYPGTDLDDGVDKVTLILHGILTLPSFAEPGGWGYELAAAIQGEFPDNTWQAMPVYWGWRADPFANMDEAISCGRSIGVSMHEQGVTKLHLIGHSLGAFVVDGIASGMKQQNASAVIQCTYLDAFTPFDLAEITEHRGELADHADSYYTSGSAACHWFTQSQFDHCVNVDVTALHAGGLGCLSSHAWPHCFYHRTVDVSGGPCDAIVGDHGLFGGFLGMWSTGWNWAWEGLVEGQNYVLPGDAGGSPGFLGDHDGMILTEREDDTLILEDINHTAYPESNVEVSGMTVTLTAAAGFAPPSVSFVVDTSDLGPVNRIRFDYQAVGDGCDGVTWLFVDGWKQAFRDERYFGGEVYAVDVFLDRMVPPGQCTISFGMACGDAEAGSAVTISDVRTGLMDARSTCAADMSSSDPDQPLPDGEVNLVDLLVALGNWGECEWDCSLAGCAGDTDFDCDVDLSDLLVIVESWGGCELD